MGRRRGGGKEERVDTPRGMVSRWGMLLWLWGIGAGGDRGGEIGRELGSEYCGA